MKKSVLLALAALALGGSTAVAQEVVLVPDCSQGYLLNKNADNWFITAQGGTTFLMAKHDIKAPLKDRWGATAALYLGKWISPNFGFRFGADWIMPKGATTEDGRFRKMNAGPFDNGYYPEKFMGLGPEFDVLVNVTNWWCGYNPERVYNLVAHGGAGAYWTWGRNYGHGGKDIGWHRAHTTILFANVGLQNNFRLSSVVNLFFDVQYTIIDFTELNHDLSVQAGLTFNLGKSDWNCPMVNQCPTWKYTDAEGDAMVARLNAQEKQINKLEAELRDCLNRKPEVKECNCEGLVTVYYPINQYGLAAREKTVLKSVAAVMKESDKKYVLTGYADNYTGNDEINTRLRQARVDGVYDFLLSQGVNPDQLNKTTDNNDLTDLGPQAAPLDRAVTIRYAE